MKKIMIAFTVFTVMFVAEMATTMALANEYTTATFKAQQANPGVSLDGKACRTEITPLGNDRYTATVVIGRGCSSPANRTMSFGRQVNGGLVLGGIDANRNPVYLIEEIGSRPEVQNGIILNDIKTNQNILFTQQAIMACEQRVAAYNSRQITLAENKGNRCLMWGTAIVDGAQLLLMNERDTGGSGITAKDLGEQRMIDLGVNYYCSKKAVARLADPAVCRANPLYIPGTPAN